MAWQWLLVAAAVVFVVGLLLWAISLWLLAQYRKQHRNLRAETLKPVIAFLKGIFTSFAKLLKEVRNARLVHKKVELMGYALMQLALWLVGIALIAFLFEVMSGDDEGDDNDDSSTTTAAVVHDAMVR